MPAVRGSFSSLLQGVSRQPESRRFDTQASEQINMVSDTTEGLTKRPSSFLVKQLNFQGNPNYVTDYDPTDKWHMTRALFGTPHLIKVQKNGHVFVFNALTGEQVTMPTTSTLGTYGSPNPAKDIKIIDIDGMVLILNNRVKVGMRTTLTGGNTFTSLHFTGATWGTVLSFEVRQVSTGDTQVFTLNMPSGVGRVVDSAGNPLSPPDPELDVSRLDPSNIINIFNQMLVGWRAQSVMPQVDASSIYLDNDFVVTAVSDGAKGTYLRHVGGSVVNVKELPAHSLNNRIVQIKPNSSNDTGTYYVKYNSSNQTWEECPKKGIKYLINPLTMPRVIIPIEGTTSPAVAFGLLDGALFNSLGTPFNYPEIKPLRSGDEQSNPLPSFIDNTIDDITVFKGRMMILSNGSIITSGTNEYWDFWFNSAVQVTEADPIDVSVQSGSIGKLGRLIVQGGDLLILGEDAQFIVGGVDALTYQTMSISRAGDYVMNLDGAVSVYGDTIYYSESSKYFSQVNVLVNGAYNNTKQAQTLTAHVKDYITLVVDSLTLSDVNDTLFVTTRDPVSKLHPNRLHVYRTAKEGNNIIQKSWGMWIYPDGFNVEFVYTHDSELYVLLTHIGDGTGRKRFLVKHYLDTGISTNLSLGLDVSMDFITQQPSINGNQVNIPHAFKKTIVVNQNCDVVHAVPDTSTGGSMNVTIPSGEVTSNYLVGMAINAEYHPTTPVIRDDKGVIDTTGHLTIHRYRVLYDKVGRVIHSIESEFHPDYHQTDEAKSESVSYLSLVSEKPYLMQGVISVPVLRDMKGLKFKIRSYDYRPVTITSIEWEGMYSKRMMGGV